MPLLVPFVIRRDGGEVVVTLQVDILADGRRVAGIYQLDGTMPANWQSIAREELLNIERIAREAGCDEFRVAGRKGWARVLPDYEPMNAPQVRNGLRKRLA